MTEGADAERGQAPPHDLMAIERTSQASCAFGPQFSGNPWPVVIALSSPQGHNWGFVPSVQWQNKTPTLMQVGNPNGPAGDGRVDVLDPASP
jgi:hypothetical protein